MIQNENGFGPLTPQQVVDAYEALLIRHPESDEVVDRHLARFPDRRAFQHAIRTSEEFQSRFVTPRLVEAIGGAFRSPAVKVDHEVSPALLAAMLARVQRQWKHLGETEPVWSVISQPELRKDRINDAVMERFWASGRLQAGDPERFAARTGAILHPGTCIELGADVGRITRHLAERFERVIAVDISPGNLAECRRNMDAAGVTNVETFELKTLEDLDRLPKADLVYSFIVIQHNPPPIQALLLRHLFGRLRPGGLALFQIPSEMEGYSFDAEDYLASEEPVMEMHGLPRPVVLAEMRRAGLEVLDVAPDDCLGTYGSFTYFGRRASA